MTGIDFYLYLCVRASLSKLHAWPLVAWFIYPGEKGNVGIGFKQVDRAGNKNTLFIKMFLTKISY